MSDGAAPPAGDRDDAGNRDDAGDRDGVTARHPAPRVYHPDDLTPGRQFDLSDEEVEHAGRSLRLAEGSAVELVDGAGHVAPARVVLATRRAMRVEVLERRFEPRPARARLVLGVGLLKGPRFETAVEKLTELGADVIVPLVSRHAEVHPRGEAKIERWQRIVISAMKQSRRAWRTELAPPMSPGELLDGTAFGEIRVAHPERPAAPAGGAGTGTGGSGAPKGGRGPEDPPAELLATGPEGGWSADELARFAGAGAIFISLGNNRLRGETAAIALLAWRLTDLGILGPARAADEAGSRGKTTS